MSSFTLADARWQAPTTGTPFHEWAFPDGTLWTQFYRNDSGYLLRFPGLADFQVSTDGLHVRCWPGPGVTDETSEHLYLNQVRLLALSARGKLVFHASAVEVGSGAIAFVGGSGRGKSTLSACLAMDGFRLIADDGLVVEASGGDHRVLPSHTSIRLWEDSEQALMPSGATKAPALPFTSKSRFLAGGSVVFCERPQSLRRVYFLGDGSATQLTFQRMTAVEALVEWTKHSFLLDVHARPMLASHFDRVAKLAEQPMHYRLDFPRRFEDLPRVRRAIVGHASVKGVHA